MIDRQTKHLLDGMSHAQDLVNRSDPAEAMKVYAEVLRLARGAGIASAHLHWAYAIACDYAGELGMAFENVSAAVAADPLALPFRNSFDVIAHRIRTALADPGRAVDDPSTPRLYALLVGAGEAEVESHVVMGRHHLAAGNVGAASAIADAAVLFYPTAPGAWELKAEVAAAKGETAAAEAARIEAVAATATERPFAVPGKAPA